MRNKWVYFLAILLTFAVIRVARADDLAGAGTALEKQVMQMISCRSDDAMGAEERARCPGSPELRQAIHDFQGALYAPSAKRAVKARKAVAASRNEPSGAIDVAAEPEASRVAAEGLMMYFEWAMSQVPEGAVDTQSIEQLVAPLHERFELDGGQDAREAAGSFRIATGKLAALRDSQGRPVLSEEVTRDLHALGLLVEEAATREAVWASSGAE